jgi:hypothetical protein
MENLLVFVDYVFVLSGKSEVCLRIIEPVPAVVFCIIRSFSFVFAIGNLLLRTVIFCLHLKPVLVIMLF